MSPVTTIAEIGKHEGQSVTLRGWLYNMRASGKLLFPQFRDGSGVGAFQGGAILAAMWIIVMMARLTEAPQTKAANSRITLMAGKHLPLTHPASGGEFPSRLR